MAQQRCDAKVTITHQLGDDLVEFFLQHVHRGLFRLLRFSSNRPYGLGQSSTIHLAIVITRYFFYLHNQLWHHVCRFLRCHMLSDALTVKFVLTSNVCYDIGSILLIACRLHRYSRNPWICQDG